jgi:hypothetical protein
MSENNRHFEKARRVLAVSLAALLAATPLLVAESAQAAAPAYTPKMADYLGVYDALQHYRFGVEKHDQKMLQSAFWEDGVNIAVPSPGQEIRLPLDGSPPQAPGGQPGPKLGPPPNAGPPPNGGPPPGSTAGPAGPGGGGAGEVWHLPLDSYIHFDSATRATHYEYFLSIYPQPEKTPEGGGNVPNASSFRTSIVGWPGHYEDILEKRHGEWRILQRKSMINQK